MRTPRTLSVLRRLPAAHLANMSHASGSVWTAQGGYSDCPERVSAAGDVDDDLRLKVFLSGA